MAPQPKRRHARGRGRVRQQAKRLRITNLIPCSSCKNLIKPHRVCPHCGYYDGKSIVVKKEKSKAKKEDEDSR